MPSDRPLAWPAAPTERTVLVTGFDPFDGDPLNPSGLAAQALDGLEIEGHRVVAAELPTEFGRSLPVLHALVRAHRPALVICCGQAGGRAALSLERVAINIQDARIADNAGARPIDDPVVNTPDAPVAYFTRLPVKAMREALQAQGIPAEVSQTAGTFVCNHVFYGLMHFLAREGLAGTRGGFIHVPWLPEQGSPSLPLVQIVAGLRVAIGCALTTMVDIRREGGAIS